MIYSMINLLLISLAFLRGANMYSSFFSSSSSSLQVASLDLVDYRSTTVLVHQSTLQIESLLVAPPAHLQRTFAA